MAAQVGRYAANRMLKKHMKTYKNKKVESGHDPFFALVEDPKRPGKYKKIKKQIPAYIPEHDATILAAVRRRAYRLDMSLFNLFGVRFGWESVIGIIPVFGDVIGALFALELIRKAMEVEGGLPSHVPMRMLINVAVDIAVGLVPFLGDLADAAFKANSKNCRLLEIHLESVYRPDDMARGEARASVGDAAAKRRNRASGMYAIQDLPPATAFDDSSDEEEERRRIAEGRVKRPAPAKQPGGPTKGQGLSGKKEGI